MDREFKERRGNFCGKRGVKVENRPARVTCSSTYLNVIEASEGIWSCLIGWGNRLLQGDI